MSSGAAPSGQGARHREQAGSGKRATVRARHAKWYGWRHPGQNAVRWRGGSAGCSGSRQVGQLGRSAPPAESAGAGETTGGAGAAGGNGAGETLEPKGCCGPPPPCGAGCCQGACWSCASRPLAMARPALWCLCSVFFLCVCVFFVFLCFGLGFDLIPGGTEIAGPGCLEKDGKERLEARWGRGGGKGAPLKREGASACAALKVRRTRRGGRQRSCLTPPKAGGRERGRPSGSERIGREG